MTERRSQQDRAARVVPELDWRTHADVLVDIYFDGVNHAPDERCYVDGALGAAMERTRIALAAVPPMLNRLTEAETTASASEHESIGTQIAKAEFAKRWDEAAQRKCDESVTPEFLRWLQDEAYREGVAANVAWNAGVAWARASASEPACKTCGGKRYVPDGVLTGEGGVEYDEPIACTKDCPDCAAPLAEAPKAVADERRAHRSSLIRAAASVTELRTWGQAHTANQSAALDEKTRQLAQSLKEAYDALPAIPLPAQEALERDAGRYRWLRDVGDATWRPFGLRDGCSADLADAAIDQAIDAALSQQKGQR